MFHLPEIEDVTDEVECFTLDRLKEFLQELRLGIQRTKMYVRNKQRAISMHLLTITAEPALGEHL